MNQPGDNNRLIIWASCLSYVLVVTLLMAYAYGLYGIVPGGQVSAISMSEGQVPGITN